MKITTISSVFTLLLDIVMVLVAQSSSAKANIKWKRQSMIARAYERSSLASESDGVERKPV